VWNIDCNAWSARDVPAIFGMTGKHGIPRGLRIPGRRE